MAWTLQDAAHLGDVVAGLSTAVGVLLGGLGYWRWRAEKQHELRSQAASEVLAVIYRVHRAVVEWGVTLFLGKKIAAGRDPDSVWKEVDDWLSRGKQDLRSATREVQATIGRTVAHLSPEELQHLEDLAALARSALMQFDAIRRLGLPPAEVLDSLEQAGEPNLQKAFDMRKAALAALGPVARFERPRMWWWAKWFRKDGSRLHKSVGEEPGAEAEPRQPGL